ncbi:MAG: hypothetical protein FWF75_08100 [Propionibacteriaceae bacterium]|nr:hypothetical protein [Propionibacteriaceae bacterium]
MGDDDTQKPSTDELWSRNVLIHAGVTIHKSDNSLGDYGILPGPEQHPLAVPAMWLAGTGILVVLPFSYLNDDASSVVAAVLSVLLGVLALIFAIIALVQGPRHVLPVVAGVLGLALLVASPLTLLAILAI